jgi:hypothetical protein
MYNEYSHYGGENVKQELLEHNNAALNFYNLFSSCLDTLSKTKNMFEKVFINNATNYTYRKIIDKNLNYQNCVDNMKFDQQLVSETSKKYNEQIYRFIFTIVYLMNIMKSGLDKLNIRYELDNVIQSLNDRDSLDRSEMKTYLHDGDNGIITNILILFKQFLNNLLTILKRSKLPYFTIIQNDKSVCTDSIFIQTTRMAMLLIALKVQTNITDYLNEINNIKGEMDCYNMVNFKFNRFEVNIPSLTETYSTSIPKVLKNKSIISMPSIIGTLKATQPNEQMARGHP